jgi:molecular chaperone DnaJ
LTDVATRPKRDYYSVLGVSRTADRDAIRRAFRMLAAEWHPDVSEDPSAPDRFREIAEAYEVLSRADTRERYDRYGFDPRGVGGFESRPGSAFGLFDDLLDLAATFPRPGRRGADVSAIAEVEFLEAIRGTERGVRYTALTVCPVCGGDGAGPGNTRIGCQVCGGRGRIREGGEGTDKPFHLRLCADCRGSGRVNSVLCPECDGTARFEAQRVLLVDIPAGAEDGQELRIPGEGNAGGPGGEPGDVILTVHVRPPHDPRGLRRLAMAGAAVGVGLLVFLVVFLATD